MPRDPAQPAPGLTEVMRPRHDLLARVAALLEAEGMQPIEREHLRSPGLALRPRPGGAVHGPGPGSSRRNRSRTQAGPPRCWLRAATADGGECPCPRNRSEGQTSRLPWAWSRVMSRSCAGSRSAQATRSPITCKSNLGAENEALEHRQQLARRKIRQHDEVVVLRRCRSRANSAMTRPLGLSHPFQCHCPTREGAAHRSWSAPAGTRRLRGRQTRATRSRTAAAGRLAADLS